MKKIVFVTLLLVLFSLHVVSATGSVVSGVVYRDSDTVSGASVKVVCDNHVRKTTSGYDGSYAVFYDPGDCTMDDKIKVSASKGRLFGSSVSMMPGYSAEVDVDISDGHSNKVGKSKLQLYGFVDDYSREVFVHLNNQGRKSDVSLSATLLNTGEYYREDVDLKKNQRMLRVFSFDTVSLVQGENIIELLAKSKDSRAVKYITYYNQ